MTKRVLLTILICAGFVFAEAPKHVLIIAGKPSHGAGEHEFPAGADILARALNESGLNLKTSVHSHSWPKEDLSSDIAFTVVDTFI